MNALQKARRDALLLRYGRLATKRDETLDRLVRIVNGMRELRRQIERYEKIRTKGAKGNEISLTGVDLSEAPALTLPWHENGDDIGI